jgi:tetratricopeptide (TPR) repeat protein
MLAEFSVCLLGFVLGVSRLPDPPQLALEQVAAPIRKQIQEVYDVLRSHPQDAAANGRLGMLLYAYQQNQSAAVCFERARALDPQEFRWTYYLASVQAALGDSVQALSNFRETVRLKPDYQPAQLKLAETLLASGKSVESQQLYETILQKDPDSPWAHYGLGRVMSGQKHRASAIDHFRKACEISPNFGAAHYALALAFRDLNDQTKAQEHLVLYQKDKLGRPHLDDPLLDAVQELRSGAHDYLKQGVALEAAGQLAQSAAAHEQALAIDPNLEQAHINLISLYGRLHQIQKAEAEYRSLLAINPNLAEAHYNFGVLLTGQGRNGEASEAFRRALDISPFYAEAHNNVGFLLLNEGRLQDAERHFRAALDSKPNYRLAHFHLGRILLHQDKIGEAIDHFQQTLGPEEDDSTPGYLYALGAAYARAGNRQSALHHIRQAQVRASALGQKELLGSIERDLKILEQVESRK